MDLTQSIPLFIIMALVLIGLPILLGRMSGKSPMEVFFGSRVNNTPFMRKNTGNTSENGSESGNDGGKESNPDGGGRSGGAGRSAGVQGTGKNSGKGVPEAKNSSRQELMQFISTILSYARRNHFYSIVPGTVTIGEDMAVLSAIVVTRSAVLGFNCFGYGGTIYADPGEAQWRQVLGGQERNIDSPVVRNQKQREILERVLAECGYGDLKTEVFGVFTAASANLKNSGNTHCYTVPRLRELLASDKILRDGGIDPRQVGTALGKYQKKA